MAAPRGASANRVGFPTPGGGYRGSAPPPPPAGENLKNIYTVQKGKVKQFVRPTNT